MRKAASDIRPAHVLVERVGTIANIYIAENIEEVERESEEGTRKEYEWDEWFCQTGYTATLEEQVNGNVEAWKAFCDTPIEQHTEAPLKVVTRRLDTNETATNELADTVLELCDLIGGE